MRVGVEVGWGWISLDWIRMSGCGGEGGWEGSGSVEGGVLFVR